MMEAGKRKVPSNFKPRAFFFDMDGTLTQNESLDDLARLYSKGEEVAKLTREAMAGGLSFTNSLKMRMKLLEGLPTAMLERAIKEIKVRDGAREFVQNCLREKVPVFILTGGFKPFAAEVSKILGVSGFVANEFGMKEGRLRVKSFLRLLMLSGKNQVFSK